MAKLGDIATYINGYAFKPEDWSDTGLPIIRIQDLTGNGYQANRYNGKYDARYLVNPGDVLISWSASLGVFVWENEPALLNQHIFKVVFDKVKVDKSFFVHQVRMILEQAASATHGATMKHLTKPVFDALPFYLPAIDEQRKIASELDKADRLISLRKKQLQKLDDLIKARFVEMFGDPETNPKGWEKESLKEHADVIVGYPFPSEGYTETGVPIVGGYNLMQGFIQWEDSKHWPNEQGYEQYLLQSNDIVMAMDRPWVNGGFKIAKIETKHLPALLIQRTACIRGRDLEQEFLYSLLNTRRFAEHCNVTGSLVPHISNRDINSFQIIIPTEKLQKQFSVFVSKVDESKQTIQQGLDKLEQIKQALMQKYFG